MFTTRELQDEIIRLKKEKDICILAHAYQSHDIWEVADFVGDSYGLPLPPGGRYHFADISTNTNLPLPPMLPYRTVFRPAFLRNH